MFVCGCSCCFFAVDVFISRWVLGLPFHAHPHNALPSPPHPPPFRLQSQFVIIACDGIWDVMEDQDAVDVVRAHLVLGPAPAAGTSEAAGGGSGAAARADASAPLDVAGLPPAKVKTAAQALVDMALARGSSDNVTALVVYL